MRALQNLLVLALLSCTGGDQGVVQTASKQKPDLAVARLFCQYNLRMRGGSGTRATNSAAALDRVIGTIDYYEILEVSRGCTEDDVKKAYR
jgi:hypothetical protein